MVCMEDFDEKKVKIITCAFCSSNNEKNHYCAGCLKSYLSDHSDQPHWNCMICKTKFSTTYIMNTYPPSVVNGTFKDLQKKNLLQSQLAMLPATDGAMQREKLSRENKRKRKELEAHIARLQQQISDLEDEVEPSEGSEPGGKRQRLTVFTRCEKGECRGFLREEDGLRGKLKCNVCDSIFCKKCMGEMAKFGENTELRHVSPEVEEGVAECDEDAVATVKELHNNVKKCPEDNCGALISKVEGCDQMFCVMCKTAFSWNTGQKVRSSNLHNPHYLEWMRNRGEDGGPIRRELADIPCGGLPSLEHFYEAQRAFFGKVSLTKSVMRRTDEKFKRLETAVSFLIMHMNHNVDVETPRYRNRDVETRQANEKDRVSYLLRDIDEKQLADRTHQMFKRNLKNNEFLDVVVMVNETGSELLRRILYELREADNSVKTADDVDRLYKEAKEKSWYVPEKVYCKKERLRKAARDGKPYDPLERLKASEKYYAICERAVEELEALRKYANETLAKIGAGFKCVAPRYGTYFWFYRSNNVSSLHSLQIADKRMREHIHKNSADANGEINRHMHHMFDHEKVRDATQHEIDDYLKKHTTQTAGSLSFTLKRPEKKPE